MGEFQSADEDFHRLVDSIYESALDVSAMPAALDLFSAYTNTESPHYLIWDKLAGHPRLGVTQHGCFSAEGAKVPDSLNALVAATRTDSALLALEGATPASASAATLAKLPRPDMFKQSVADLPTLDRWVSLFDTPEVCVLMSGKRMESSTFNETYRRARLSQIMPHWARAARLQHRNFELSGMAALGLASLDTLDFGVMVLQGDMRVRYANSWAESLVQADSNFSLEGGLLHARSDTLQRTLRTMLDNAIQRRSGEVAAGSWMHITSGGKPVPIIVMPLVSRQPVEGPWQLPFAMMLFGNSESRAVLDAAVLASLFGLSRKESIIATRLAAGETLNEIAEREFLSPHTVRVHIRDILRKTGTHRQSELVRLLHLLPGVDLERGAGGSRRPHI